MEWGTCSHSLGSRPKREHQPVVLAGNVQKNLPNGLIDTPKTTNQEGDVLQTCRVTHGAIGSN